MAVKKKKKCFGEFDGGNWNCEPDTCEDSKACKKASTKGTKAPAKEEEKPVKKVNKVAAARAKAKAASTKAKEKTPPKIVEEKAPAKADKKSTKKKAKKKNVVIKEAKTELVEPETKMVTKEVTAKVNKLAEEIKVLKTKAAKSFSDLVLKGAPKMKKAQELLPPQAFDEWCRDKIGYDRTMALRIIQAYETFKDRPELITNLGATKLLAVLPHPEPVKFLEKHQDDTDTPSREFRDIVAADAAEVSGEEPKAKAKKNRLDIIIKATRSITSTMEKTFMDLNNYAGRKNVKLDASQQEALQLHLEQMEEWIEKTREILEKAQN